MTDREQLRRHLEFFRELGVEGVSRDATWRARGPAGAEPRGGERANERADSAPESPARAREVHGVSHPAYASGGGPTSASDVSAPAETGGTAAAPETLEAVRADLGECTRCKLHGGRTNLVFGVGSPTADLVFVGEAPGRDEDRQGIPFVGRAGQLLTRIIAAIGLSRDEVYIANVIKCRPPNNRNPEPDEVATCEPFLFRQLDVIRPRVVVALGGFAIRTLLDTAEPVSRLRGRVFDYRGAKLIPTFHPAFLLRSPERKRDVWEDMKRVRALLAEPGAAP